jgi:prepilin-type processing-associated H-X9-DG protein
MRHERTFPMNFADGHVEALKLRDPASMAMAQITANNSDWIRLKQFTTVQ